MNTSLIDTGTDKDSRKAERTAPGCSNCRYCGILSAMDKSVQLICRRYPPKVQLSLLVLQQGATWQSATGWPAVQKHEWCGCYESGVQ